MLDGCIEEHEADPTKDLWCQPTAPVTALDGVQGCIMSSVHTCFIFALKKAKVV